jgi:tetratricopeptide (TPR) repeat protein
MPGLVVDGAGFEVVVGDQRVGPRRSVEAADAELLGGLTARYVRAVRAGSDAGVLVEVGRELYAWLDGDQGQLGGVLERAATPLVFEVRGPRVPSDRAWAVLRAPFEVLARPSGGFLAEDELARFCVVRRLGAARPGPGLDGFRLGLAFMASSPRGQHELDFEAEEAAILNAVGESRVDLVVEDTGDPEQLGHRLAELGGLPVVHLSCHGLNTWSVQPGGPGVPVLLMEDDVGADRPTTAGDLVRLFTVGPRLLFVSACLTATGADATGHLRPGRGQRGGAGDGGGLAAHSLATALVSAGVPAVIGWDGSVGDRALRPLSVVAQRKLQRRQQALTPAERLAERSGLARRALQVCRGNPGLQDLIVLRLVYGEQVGLAQAEAAVAGMEAYLRLGGLPPEAQVRAFLENLALDTLLGQAGAAHVALLRAVTLFDQPVPEPVVEVLAGEVGGSAARLRGLGLVDLFPDSYDPQRPALAANALAAGRVEPLSAGERATLAGLAVGPLFAGWGGPTPHKRRNMLMDLQLTQLALLGDDPGVVAACAAGAVRALRRGPAAHALQLGRQAVALLDRHGREIPVDLLRQVADAALTSGDGDTGGALLRRVVKQVQAGHQDTADPLDKARVSADYAGYLMTRGEPGQAEDLLQQAHHLFTAAGSAQEAAVAMGRVADIAFRRGDYDEALRIRREVELPVYERLGDTRATAVCWGKIADIAFRRGDYDEALRIRREVELPVYERLGETRETAVCWGNIADIAFRRGDYDEAAALQHRRLTTNKQLGDLDGIAAATWGLAQIDLARQDYQSAFPRLAESFQILQQLRRADGIAVVGNTLGQLLLAARQLDQANLVLRASRAAATGIGMTDLAEQIDELLGQQFGKSEDTSSSA